MVDFILNYIKLYLLDYILTSVYICQELQAHADDYVPFLTNESGDMMSEVEFAAYCDAMRNTVLPTFLVQVNIKTIYRNEAIDEQGQTSKLRNIYIDYQTNKYTNRKQKEDTKCKERLTKTTILLCKRNWIKTIVLYIIILSV